MIQSTLYLKRTVLISLALLLVCAGVLAYFFRDSIFTTAQLKKTVSTVTKEDDERIKQGKKREQTAQSRAAIKERSVNQEGEGTITTEAVEMSSDKLKNGKKTVAGWVVITDPWGRKVTSFRSGVTGNGWLALPTRACLGGNNWQFYPDSGGKAEISGGLWINGDRVGLWHLAEDTDIYDGQEIAVWNEGNPVSWISLESADEYHSITLRESRTEGFFISAPLPDYINEIGIFLQSNKIVGWTFGKWLKKGYMWPGEARTGLKYNTWVRYFYNITFANGREEKFARALAMEKGYSGLEQLASFVEGFQVQPKLAPGDTPLYLLPEEIIKQIRVLVNDALHSGDGSRVIDILNSQMLKRIGDISLLMSVVPAIVDNRGFEAAISEIEDSGRYITRQLGRDVPALETLHVQLYQKWLQSLVSAGGINEGLQAYNAAIMYYPDDPYIHLLGVELTLLSGDWEEAERMLYMRNYPPALQDRYELLALRIAEIKGQEEKVVIHFPRGSNRIKVTAAINGTLYQDFLVDTGSTVVTIPSSTADALGLEIVHGQRRLSTASGVETASEVIIDAIEIDGWVEYDIRALVLDMPGQPGMGLLGLNYLGRFQMDLKPEEGTMLLMPR
jgi:clan AA aspartic protease (TIGR02281 family)